MPQKKSAAILTEAQLAALPEADRAEAEALQEDLVGGESLRDFIVRLSPHQPPPRHFDPVIDVLEEARWSPQKVGISMPPGHGKTTLILNAYAWWLTKNPADTNAYASYNERQAFSKSVLARALSVRAGVELSDEVNTKAEWRTVQGGGLLATGIGGGLTGQRVQGLLVVDDPYRNQVDAYSSAYRDDVDDWLKTVALTRRAGASTLVIHTRWHDDDEIGRLAKRGWRIINLPAIAEKGDVLGRAEGEALWGGYQPTSLPRLKELRRELGEFDFAALFQGSPRPRGGAVFGEPHYYDPATLDVTGCQIVLAADPAASKKTSADYSAAVVLAIKGQGVSAIAYLLKVYREQVTIPQFVRDLRGLQVQYGDTEINVESVGAFLAIPQMLRELDPDIRLKEITPEGDKFTRAQRVAAAWNDARVLVPANFGADTTPVPWLGPFLDELAKFTGVNDRRDDQVDALSHAWNNQDGLTMFDVV